MALQEWSKALVNESISHYNLMYDMMRENLDEKLLKEQVEVSKQVTKVCCESLEKAMNQFFSL